MIRQIKRVVFGRQIDGKMDLWIMNIDGTEERQLTFTEDEQEGAPFFLPDNKTITTRWSKRSEKCKTRSCITKMTVATMNVDTGEIIEQTSGGRRLKQYYDIPYFALFKSMIYFLKMEVRYVNQQKMHCRSR